MPITTSKCPTCNSTVPVRTCDNCGNVIDPDQPSAQARVTSAGPVPYREDTLYYCVNCKSGPVTITPPPPPTINLDPDPLLPIDFDRGANS